MTRRPGVALDDRDSGYVFPLALWSIAIIAILVAAAYTTVSAANTRFQRLIEREAALADFQAAESFMLELLLTEPIGLTGLQVGGRVNTDPISGGFGEGGTLVLATGEPYLWEGARDPVVVRLIALNGLINLSENPANVSHALLMSLGHSRSEADRLSARLGDFIDEDDLRRLGGAESGDYPEGSSPRNAPLTAASEACGALGWADAVDLCADPRMLDLIASAGGRGAMTARLVPTYLIKLITGEEYDERRTLETLGNRTGLVRFEDLGLEDLDGLNDNSALPGPDFLIMTHRRDARLVQLTRIDLTMASLYEPFHIPFSYVIGGSEIEATFHVDDIDEIEALPEAG